MLEKQVPGLANEEEMKGEAPMGAARTGGARARQGRGSLPRLRLVGRPAPVTSGKVAGRWEGLEPGCRGSGCSLLTPVVSPLYCRGSTGLRRNAFVITMSIRVFTAKEGSTHLQK